jgi:hypothetical protein
LKTLAGGRFSERTSAKARFASTHAELLAAPVDEHAQRARMWAQDALAGWVEAHPEFERLARSALAA